MGSVLIMEHWTNSIPSRGSWREHEFAKPVHMCFVDLEKPFDRVPQCVMWGVLQEYAVLGPMLVGLSSPCTNRVRVWSTLPVVSLRTVFSESRTPSGLPFVTDFVHNVYGQNF